MKRITLAAVGTRGDVQPMIALGRGLKAAGNDVTMIAGSNFAAWIAGHGLRFVPTVDMEALMSSEKGVAWSQASDDPLKQLRMMRALVDEHARTMTEPIHACAPSSDLLVSSFPVQALVQAAGEKTGVKHLNALLQPLHRTRSAAASLNPWWPWGDSVLNRWAGAVADRLIWWISAAVTNRYRTEVGLEPHTAATFGRVNRHAPAVLGFSRHVVPRPPDWPVGVEPTGYWFLDEAEGWIPPADLVAFLEAGAPPVYVGFGSVSGPGASGAFALIAEAARVAGRRVVIASGWGGRPEGGMPSHVYTIASAPHRWLLPRMAAVVHHGGAGTTAAGLRAGRPTMVVPHMSDQPYWGRRVFELGAGVKPVPRHKLTVATLAAGLEGLTGDRRLAERAGALGAAIESDRGIEAAVAAIGNVMS